MVPVLGEPADALNTGISLARGDCVGAGLSLAAMVPLAGWGATAGKVGRRGLSHADELADLARWENEVGMLGRHTDDVPMPPGQRVMDTRCSFSEDTEVKTEDGDVFISELEPGDHVLAYDEKTDNTGVYTVTNIWTHEDPVVTTLTIDGKHIETTPEHPFYSMLRRWVPAVNLHKGDHIRRVDGSYGIVEDIAHVQRPEVMYNLTVDTAHTFFAGKDGWLVHNACNPYEVGRYNDLVRQSVPGDDLEIHHLPQKHPAGQVVQGYEPITGPSIALPRIEHRRLPTRRENYQGTVSDLIESDLKDLHKYTNAPSSVDQQLRDLFDQIYPRQR